MKCFKDIEILYEKYFVITRYWCPISNCNVNTIITDINNTESNTNSDSSNEVYYINNNNINRNNIVNNSSSFDSENRNIANSDSENNSIVTNSIVNRSIGEHHVYISNFLKNECVNIYMWRGTEYIAFSSWWKRLQIFLI